MLDQIFDYDIEQPFPNDPTPDGPEIAPVPGDPEIERNPQEDPNIAPDPDGPQINPQSPPGPEIDPSPDDDPEIERNPKTHPGYFNGE